MNDSRRVSSASQDAVTRFIKDRVGRKWCLFLDRDGVLNRQILGDYVRNWSQFEWLPNSESALKILSDWTPYIVIVTNQQGVGKNLMAAEHVDDIHRRISEHLSQSGVTITDFSVCPHLVADGCNCRKPRPNLVLDWLNAHPDIDPVLSLVAGDSPTDIGLAHNVAAVTGGCSSVQIGRNESEFEDVDARFGSLWDFAVTVQHIREGQDS